MKILGIQIHCENPECGNTDMRIIPTGDSVSIDAISEKTADEASAEGCPVCESYDVSVMVVDATEAQKQENES